MNTLRTKTIMVRLTTEEKQLIEEYAKDNSITIASWVRQLIIKEVKNSILKQVGVNHD